MTDNELKAITAAAIGFETSSITTMRGQKEAIKLIEWGIPHLLDLIDTLSKENERMQTLLSRSLEKLRIYHRQTNGEYAGGEDLEWLTKDIESAISPSKT